jgi:hypothetical protein
MVAIPFPTSSAPSWRQQESAGRLINLCAEALAHLLLAMLRQEIAERGWVLVS